MRASNALIGSPVERIEDLRFLRGRGEYVDDLAPSDLLHAAIVRSPLAHGLVRSIESDAALALPGVLRVIAASDLGAHVPTIPLRRQVSESFEPFRQPVIAADRVRYVGEPVAVVVATSAALAEDAADRVRVVIDPLPVVADAAAAELGSILLFEAAQSNRVGCFAACLGDADAACRDASYRRLERFSTHRHTALPMEPRGVVGIWDERAGRLTLCGAAKLPFFTRRVLAQAMGLAEDSVEVIENDVGGGFGARGEFYPEDFLVPFAARLLRRPVKWTEDRREHLLAINHAREMTAEIEIACKSDGTVIGIRGAIAVDLGAYLRPNGLTPARNVVQFLSGPYRVPNIRVESTMLVTNKAPVGTYRAPGRFEGSFFCERLLDMAAGDLGIDPIEMRRRNLVGESEMPYRLATISPPDAHAETECDSGDYRSALDRCLGEFDWAGKSALQGKLIEGRHHGIAAGCFIEGGASGPREAARLVLGQDGTVSVYVGSSAIGQGLETIFAQIAADALGLPMARIAGVFHGSTTHVREGFGSYHSRSTVMGGSAILDAAAKLRAAICAAAARRLGVGPDAIELVDDAAVAAGVGSVRFASLAEDRIAAEGSFASHHQTYAYGAAAVHVAVDPRTGLVEIIDYVVIEDVGRIVNPRTLLGQIVGGTVQGLGAVFLERLVYDDEGQLLTGSLADYLLPTASEFPRIRAFATETHPSPHNPLGAKGAGEGGIIPTAGVVANAVAAALSSFGVAPNDLPLAPARLWQMIEARRRRVAMAPARSTPPPTPTAGSR